MGYFFINLQLYAPIITLVNFISQLHFMALFIFSSAHSKPVMDLLVTLCASYHMNPSDYTVEVLSANKNNISFKPNSPIGSLEAEKIVLKPRVVEEKIRRPYMPEVTTITLTYGICRWEVELIRSSICRRLFASSSTTTRPIRRWCA